MLLLLAGFSAAFAGKYEYTTVEGDPLDTKMYTLPNGLKIFMTVNRDKPRIQTYIAVRVGGKNDPAETTGLAHYFEHLMFKGTEQFGTSDYAAEKPMLDQIEQLFEVYRVTTDSAARRDIYRQIDSISYQASLIAIPNEYDKLMALIGAEGTNAYTSQDVTCYVEDIPSNQIENWAMIQADRFRHPVLRGFHTELETIYEEKNMSLTQDNRKMNEAMLRTLFPSHPYGTQTVLGTQENLKNPSITNVKNYHKQWYVPNNMAICLSGDFDPDEMVDIIAKYFGDMEPNPALPVLTVKPEAPITDPVKVEVLGTDAERIYLAWRIPAAKDPDKLVIDIISEVLNNGDCGIIDVNLNNSQKVLGAGAGSYDLADQGAFLLIGLPNAGQTLDEVRDLLLDQMAQLREGKFADDLIPAIVNNTKLSLQQSLESNSSRADYYVDAFVNGEDWADRVADFHRLDSITKDDVVRVARKYFGPENYAAIYKLQGQDTTIVKMPKPELTPIATNRDASSEFLRRVAASEVEPIEPVFVDFKRDLTVLRAKNDIPVYYTRNATNDISTLIYVVDFGTNDDRRLTVAADYFDLLGTPDMSADDLKREFYNLACSWRLSLGGDRSYIVITGLSENLPKAAGLFENFLANATVDTEAWNRLVDQIGQSRDNAKKNQRSNFSALATYVMYGPENPVTTRYTMDELRGLEPADIIAAVRDLYSYEQEVIYYGNLSEKEIVDVINRIHPLPDTLRPVPEADRFAYVNPEETVIFVAPYDAKQLYMTMFANRGGRFDIARAPMVEMYNEYFGGGMNSIVFQEMRESRSLAYSAFAFEMEPSVLTRPYVYRTQIATQNDKMLDAIDAFLLIINDMPESQAAFDLARNGLEARLRSERVIKDAIAWAYLGAKRLGLDREERETVYNALPDITLEDVIKYQQDNVKGATYYYGILGDPADLDLDALAKIGRVVMLTTEDIFGE